MTDKELHDQAVNIVIDNSGGIKFIELLFELIRSQIELDENLPEQLERVLRESSVVKVLDYTYKQLNRSKMFIYTP